MLSQDLQFLLLLGYSTTNYQLLTTKFLNQSKSIFQKIDRFQTFNVSMHKVLRMNKLKPIQHLLHNCCNLLFVKSIFFKISSQRSAFTKLHPNLLQKSSVFQIYSPDFLIYPNLHRSKTSFENFFISYQRNHIRIANHSLH